MPGAICARNTTRRPAPNQPRQSMEAMAPIGVDRVGIGIRIGTCTAFCRVMASCIARSDGRSFHRGLRTTHQDISAEEPLLAGDMLVASLLAEDLPVEVLQVECPPADFREVL